MRMRWGRLLQGYCPKCDAKLVDTGVGLECLVGTTCRFFISTEKAKSLKNKIRDDARKHRMDRNVTRP